MEEKEYRPLRKKYTLPSFVDMDKEFEISDIETGNFPLKQIRVKMIEKIETYINLLNDVINPDPHSLINLQEMNNFKKDEREKMYETFKTLMILFRKHIKLDLLNKEEEDAVFISLSYKEWQEQKEDLLAFLDHLIGNWKTKTVMKQNLEYLG